MDETQAATEQNRMHGVIIQHNVYLMQRIPRAKVQTFISLQHCAANIKDSPAVEAAMDLEFRKSGLTVRPNRFNCRNSLSKARVRCQIKLRHFSSES